MNVCVIDIGSNTVKASVYKISDKRIKTEVAFKGNKEKLITYIDSERKMSAEGINKLHSSLERLLTFSKEHNCERVFAFATASLRNVANAKEILELVYSQFGIEIDILSEEEEALCSLKGLLSDPDTSEVKHGIMIDMGGGSTEIVLFENSKSPLIKSLDFGCLSLSQNFFSEGILEKDKTASFIKKELLKCPYIRDANCPVYLIGGTARAALKLINIIKKQNTKTLKNDLSDFKIITDNLNSEEFISLVKKTSPQRVTTVFTGAIAYSEILKFIKPTKIFVSDSGVRDGYLERILP